MAKPRLLWEILVPCEMNGKPVRTRHHRQWDNFVRNISGGLTILKPAKGQWICKNTNQLFVERMIPVRICCTDNQIEQIIQHTMTHYNQLAVMAYKISEEVKLKYRDERN